MLIRVGAARTPLEPLQIKRYGAAAHDDHILIDYPRWGSLSLSDKQALMNANQK